MEPFMMRIPKKREVISFDELWESFEPFLQSVLQSQTQEISLGQAQQLVFSFCTNGYAPRLYENIKNLLQTYFRHIQSSLQSISSEKEFFYEIGIVFKKVDQISQNLQAILFHLDQMYLSKQNLEFKKEILQLFSSFGLPPSSLHKIFDLLPSLASSLDPSLLKPLICSLYILNPEFANLDLNLFSVYIPCLIRSRGCQEDALEIQVIVERLKKAQIDELNLCPLKRPYVGY